MMNPKTTRRTFLNSATALSAALFVPASVLGLGKTTAANDRINVGCIGVGPRGTRVMRDFLSNDSCRVVALCDVKSNVLSEKQKLVHDFYGNQDCQTYADFRELVARDDIDACLVATCDHWHVLNSLAAVRSGKDVYMEKPMGLTIEEDQAMRAAVLQENRIFQFGTQQRSSANFRRACEIARNGLLGEVHTINVWSPGSAQRGTPEQVPPPAWLDYDLWLGPAQYTPYTKNRCSNELWWHITDYALGFIAGWGIHPMDIALWGCEPHFQGVWHVEGRGKFPKTGVCNAALTWDVQIQVRNGLTVNFKGESWADEWKKRYGDESSHGTVFEGPEGWVFVRRGKIEAQPKSLLEANIQRPLHVSENHVGNFLHSIRGRQPAISSIETAVKSDVLCHISDIAIRREEKLLFDSQRETFIGNHEANKRLQRPMRSPWRLR